MPVTPTYPGVYIEELPSGVRTITGVSTSVTALIGRARRGPVNKATTIFSYSDYERDFGGLWEESALSYAVHQYFLNGGSQAIIVRVFLDDGNGVATISFPEGGVAPFDMVLDAASPGGWGENLLARVDHQTKEDPDGVLFNLKIKDSLTGIEETHLNLSSEELDVRYVGKVLEENSTLVRLNDLTARPAAMLTADPGVAAVGGSNGSDITLTEIIGSGSTTPKTGLSAFDDVDIINLLSVPPYLENNTVLDGDIDESVMVAALAYAKSRRAIFLVDPPVAWNNVSTPDPDSLGIGADANAALYFPRIKSPDLLQDGRLGSFVPSGAIAGLIARTDAQRGVWKAPAGIDASLNNVPELTVQLTDQENGLLNPMGVNCLRTFKGVGRVAWGARTMRGSDILADQWKYLPVRRLALYLEESLYRGSQWVVFEPNDEPLWAQIRLNFGAFMHNLFRQGAFQGSTPKEAYLVKCDSETTTQNDINSGIVNIVVGFAPLKPAEFVIIKIQQLAGQVDV